MSHVVIGTCPLCSRSLRAKEHAPRSRMHITCHCGWHGDIDVDEGLVAHAGEMRAHGAGHRSRVHHKSLWQRFVKPLVFWWRRTSPNHTR